MRIPANGGLNTDSGRTCFTRDFIETHSKWKVGYSAEELHDLVIVDHSRVMLASVFYAWTSPLHPLAVECRVLARTRLIGVKEIHTPIGKDKLITILELWVHYALSIR